MAVLESLYQHRLLSTRQVHVLHLPNAHLRSAQRVLARLHRAKLAATTRVPGGGGLWHLTPLGIEAVETIPNRAEPRRKVIHPQHAAGPLQQHTLAVNDVGIAFVRAARQHGHDCGPYNWRHEIAHPLGPPPGRRKPEQLITDALLTYQITVDDGTTSFHYRFVELDRATMPVNDLAIKLARYGRLYRHTAPVEHADEEPIPLWARLYPIFPIVLLVLARDARHRLERRMQVVLALCREHPDLHGIADVELSVCLLEDLVTAGPFAEIFRTSSAPKDPTDWLGAHGQP